MSMIERAPVLPIAFRQSPKDCPSGAGRVVGPTFRLYGPDAGKFLLAAAICWGLAPLLIMGLLLASEAARLVRDTLGMAGPGGEL